MFPILAINRIGVAGAEYLQVNTQLFKPDNKYNTNKRATNGGPIQAKLPESKIIQLLASINTVTNNKAVPNFRVVILDFLRIKHKIYKLGL